MIADNLRFPWILTVSGVKLLGVNGVYGGGVIIGLGIGKRWQLLEENLIEIRNTTQFGSLSLRQLEC